jgi:hypothetical protein
MSSAFFVADYLFTERTDRVSAGITLHAKAAMSQFSQFPSSNPFTRENTGKDQFEDRGLGIHAAGGNTEDGD